MQEIVNAFNVQDQRFSMNDFLPAELLPLKEPVPQSLELYEQQLELSAILERAKDTHEAVQMLSRSSLAHSDWKTESWSPYMLETALRIAQKWKQGW
jgi:hypothetical protein